MNGKQTKLNSLLYIYLIVGFLMGSVLILSFMDSIAKQDAWFIIITAFILCIPFILSYSTLSKWHPGKNLIEICDLVYGRFIGKFVSMLYILYFTMLFTFNLRDLADFYTGFIMPETPKLVFLLVFILISAYAVKKGITSIARVSIFAVCFAGISIIFTFILLLSKMDFTNFLPILELSPITYFKATSHFMIVPFCELAVFLMVMPALDGTQKINKQTTVGLCIAALIMLTISIQNTAVLGISTSTHDMASYQAVRLIDLGEFFTRVELLVGMGFTMVLFIKISVIYFATVKSISQLFKMQDHAPLILPVGGIMIILALITYDSTVSHYEFALKYNVYLIALFEFILPPLSLLIAKIRRTIKKAILDHMR